MEEKTRFMSFNCQLKSSSYGFLLPFLYICIRYFSDELFHISKPEDSLMILKYNLPYLFYLFLPKILSILCILIVKSNTKGESFVSKENILIRNYHINVVKKNKNKILFLIYIISFLEALHDDGNSLLYYYEIYYTNENVKKYIKGWLVEEKTCFIIFVPLFAYLILNTEIHRHHYLALLFGYFGFFFVNGSRFVLSFSFFEDIPFHLLKMYISLIYSLSLVLIKYIMINYVLFSPYKFLFYNGIFNILNSIILILLQYPLVINLPDKNKNIDKTEENKKYFSHNFVEIFGVLGGQDGKFYIYLFLFFIISFFYYIIKTLIIYNNSIFFIILLEAILPFDSDVIRIILNIESDHVADQKGKILKRFFCQIAGYAFLLFGSLILNEIIIFNCFGLNKYTFKDINRRGVNDSNTIPVLEVNNCDDNSSEELEE